MDYLLWAYNKFCIFGVDSEDGLRSTGFVFIIVHNVKDILPFSNFFKIMSSDKQLPLNELYLQWKNIKQGGRKFGALVFPNISGNALYSF